MYTQLYFRRLIPRHNGPLTGETCCRACTVRPVQSLSACTRVHFTVRPVQSLSACTRMHFTVRPVHSLSACTRVHFTVRPVQSLSACTRVHFTFTFYFILFTFKCDVLCSTNVIRNRGMCAPLDCFHHKRTICVLHSLLKGFLCDEASL
jgi:hypothetical protein